MWKSKLHYAKTWGFPQMKKKINKKLRYICRRGEKRGTNGLSLNNSKKGKCGSQKKTREGGKILLSLETP